MRQSSVLLQPRAPRHILERVADAESSLILADIVLKGTEKVLGVFGSHDDTALYASLRHVRCHIDEIEEKLVARMGNHGEVGIVAAGHFRREFYLEFLLVVCHNCICVFY